MKRVGAIAAIAAIALAACGGSEAPEAADASESGGRQTRRAASLEIAESPSHDVGTLGESCQHGRAPRIDPPDARWEAAIIQAFEEPGSPPFVLPRGGARIRYPRDWQRASGLAFSVTHYDGWDTAEVGMFYMKTVPAPAGLSAWDLRIQAVEQFHYVEAASASPMTGGRCLVQGQSFGGPFEALLFPLGGDETLVVIAEFGAGLNTELQLDDVPTTSRQTALRILDSLELLDESATAI